MHKVYSGVATPWELPFRRRGRDKTPSPVDNNGKKIRRNPMKAAAENLPGKLLAIGYWLLAIT